MQQVWNPLVRCTQFMNRGKVVIKIISQWVRLSALSLVLNSTYALAQSTATLMPSPPQLAASSYVLIDFVFLPVKLVDNCLEGLVVYFI